MMGRIYLPNYTPEQREARAVAEYTDVRIQYGKDSQEEQRLYGILVQVFPNMKKIRKGFNNLEAAFAAELSLMPGDEEAVEKALQKAGLKE